MILPDGQPLALLDGVLCELAEGGRLILWVPGARDGEFRHWDRVGTVAGATVVLSAGLRTIEVGRTPARRQIKGGVGRLLRGLAGGEAAPRRWTLPGGEAVEQCGPRQAGLVLAWGEAGSGPVDEARVRAVRPEGREVRAVGEGLFLVSGAGVIPARRPADPSPEVAVPDAPQDSPAMIAGRALDAARAAGDEGATTSALLDLGAALLIEGDAHRAARLFKEALDRSRRLADPRREVDALLNFALAAHTLGHADRARDLLGTVLARARALGDRVVEKLALERLARALQDSGDPAGSLARLEQARAVASAVGDHRHEADLLWEIAARHGEANRRDDALAAAAASVSLFRRIGHPAAGWYARHLADFRSGIAPPGPAPGEMADRAAGGPGGAEQDRPGLLRMARTATKAMAKFVGSGFKTTPAGVYRDRLATCAGCEHHTGLRCRACGCFTAAKAKLLHESCPAGRWQA